MKLKIQNPVEGPTYVALIDPATDQHEKAVEVGPNQEVEIELSTVTDASQISIGSIVDRDAEEAAPAAEEPAADGATSGEQPAQGEGEGEAPADETPPSTTAASETALYLIEGDVIPEGFALSGLETVDGKALYHFAGDTAGGDPTGNADSVSVFAEAGDNEQPVQAATDTPPPVA